MTTRACQGQTAQPRVVPYWWAGARGRGPPGAPRPSPFDLCLGPYWTTAADVRHSAVSRSSHHHPPTPYSFPKRRILFFLKKKKKSRSVLLTDVPRQLSLYFFFDVIERVTLSGPRIKRGGMYRKEHMALVGP